MDSSEDYAGLRALMETGAPDLLAVDGTSGRCEGLIWQLLPAGEPAVPSPAPLGKT